MSELTDTDIYHFREGTFFRAYDRLGAHPETLDGIPGTRFAVWAPNAAAVHVIGDFNDWSHDSHPMTARADGSGIWETRIAQVGPGAVYKYFVQSQYGGFAVEKSDPYAFRCEEPPRTGAVVWDNGYEWRDVEWAAQLRQGQRAGCALVHLRSSHGFLAAGAGGRQPLTELSRDRPSAGRLRRGDGVHAR